MISEYERYCILKEELERVEDMLNSNQFTGALEELCALRTELTHKVRALHTKLVREARNEPRG